MSTDYSSLVSKVWNFAHVLRDQGIGYGDYVEQITFLLFLKMDEERTEHLGEPSANKAGNRGRRKESERFRKFDVADLLKRDKLNLDIFWLKDDNLDDIDSLPLPDQIATEIVENLQAALEAFQSVADELAKKEGA